jgi:hypothetical protein
MFDFVGRRQRTLKLMMEGYGILPSFWNAFQPQSDRRQKVPCARKWALHPILLGRTFFQTQKYRLYKKNKLSKLIYK